MKTSTVVLLALSGLPRAIAALEKDTPCRARAWVRAPDLEPGRVVQGDVRVKLDGSCDGVSSYSLGLRFAERSWVKTRRAGVKLPELPTASQRPVTFVTNNSVFETNSFGWRNWDTPGVDASAWEQYDHDMKDPALWLVREEERIGFETKYVFRDGERASYDVVESFAILVPSTNYPPAFDRSLSSSSRGETDIADAEHIYQYFVDVTFTNGTQRQIPAGYTSFNAAVTRGPPVPETVNVTAPRHDRRNQVTACEKEDVRLRDEFTLEVTFPNGRHIEEGSAHNITVVSHQLGPGLQRLLGLQYLDTLASQKRRWAAKLAADNQTAETLLQVGSTYEYQLRPKADDKFAVSRRYSWQNKVELPQFSQDGVVENGTMFTTDAVTVQFEVPQQSYPHFEMYYQTCEVELLLNLQVRNVSSEDAGALSSANAVDMSDDDYEWTPMLAEKERYRLADTVHARIPLFVHRKLEAEDHARREAIHYLSPEARAPIFVDPSSVTALLQKTADERNSLTPIAQAKFVTPADGNAVKHKYYGVGTWRGAPARPYYVGDTWLRKVARGESRETSKKDSTLMIQT